MMHGQHNIKYANSCLICCTVQLSTLKHWVGPSVVLWNNNILRILNSLLAHLQSSHCVLETYIYRNYVK
jgi:hypothetical protein